MRAGTSLGRLLWAVSVAFVLLLAGCASPEVRTEELARHVDVFGVALYSRTEPESLSGVRSVREECLRGFERDFEALGVRIGYTTKGVVRSLTTRSSGTGVFGVRVGDPGQDARQRLLAQGLRPGDTPWVFHHPLCRITLLTDENDRVFGLRVEAQENLL